MTVNDVAGTPPKRTLVAPVKWLPLMVTEVPPAVEAVDVVRPVTTGAAFVNVN